MKTVELIEEQTAWEKKTNIIPRNKIVQVRIHYGEIDVSTAVKSMGGRWNKSKKHWEIAYGDAVDLGLEGRIIHEKKKIPNIRNVKPP